MDKIKDLENDLENREKIKALFENRNKIPDDDAIVKEFTYANEEVDDDGNWWLIVGAICFVWTILGIIGAIKVIQWTILFLKTLLG